MTAIVDYCGFRSQASPGEICGALVDVFGQFGDVSMQSKGHGSRGYEDTGAVLLDGMRVGGYMTGGRSQREWSTFELEGAGCQWVKDWPAAVEALSGVDFEPRRVDVAVDTFRREVTHDKIIEAFEAGEFNNAGRPPKMLEHLARPREDGSSVYIGVREGSVKMLRGYEKGFEQAKRFGMVPGFENATADGFPIADWYRCEVEFKAQRARPLPEDILLRPDEYFAGAYPFCRQLIEAQPFQLRTTRDKRPQLELGRALGLIKNQWGRVLFTALEAHGGDITGVWDLIVGCEHSEALIEAGVLLVDHPAAG